MENQLFKDRVFLLIQLFGDGKPKRFADKIKIAVTTVMGWTSGSSLPGGSHLISLRDKLGISIDWLLTGEGEMMKKDDQGNKAAEDRAQYSTDSIAEKDDAVLALLRKAQEVLHADHHSNPALESNIRSFHASLKKEHESLKKEKRLEAENQDLKQRLTYVEQALKRGHDPPRQSNGADSDDGMEGGRQSSA